MAETAVIVGASGGIGRAVASALAADGYHLVLNSRRAGPLEELAAALPDAAWVAGDGADEGVAERVRELAGEVAVLVHTAGILVNSPAREQPAEVFDRVLRANLSSAYASVHALLPAMRAGSRIVFVSSTSALHPTRGLTAYTAAKAGLKAMAGVLARELEEDGISVHVVSPGPVDTAMLDADTRRFAVLAPEDVAGAITWVAGLPPEVVVPELLIHAPVRGPFATRWYEPPVSPDGGDRTPP
jgi:NAD(P)-dependent dehydrogenase (short-subunit alcohol dehydrogenase family)